MAGNFLILEPSRWQVAIAGRVTDAQTGQPLSGVQVTIAAAPAAFNSWLSLHAKQYEARWGAMVERAEEAAKQIAAASGKAVEVIDLRTLMPWDRETVLASAAKTRLLLVAHEAVQVAGFGAEIAATVAEELGVRVKRIGGPRIPVGYSKPLEDEARMTSERITQALAQLDRRRR